MFACAFGHTLTTNGCCPAGGDTSRPFGSVGNYARREGGRGSSWSAQVPAVTHRGTYSEPRGGQSNFTRGPLPSRQSPASKYELHLHAFLSCKFSSCICLYCSVLMRFLCLNINVSVICDCEAL